MASMLPKVTVMKPLAALTRPSWLIALGILFLNDHVWKHGSAIPHLLTGKISDFAGLYVAPALLAALLACRSRRAVALCHLAVAIGFALVKTWPAATHLYDAALSLVIPSKGVTDPSDLMALPMVLLSWRALVPHMHGDGRKFWLVIGCALCMADEPSSNPLAFTIVNHTSTALNVSVNTRATGVAVDCNAKTLRDNPSALLTRPLFGDAARERLNGGDKRAASDSNTPPGCSILWVEADALPPVLLFVPSDELDNAGPVELAIDRAADGTPRWSTASAYLHIDPQANVETNPACIPPDDRMATWGPVEKGEWTVDATPPGKDGCFSVELWPARGAAKLWQLCIPDGSWPFSAGDTVELEVGPDLVLLKGERVHLAVFRGPISPPASEDVPDVTYGPVYSDCSGAPDECGTVWQNDHLVTGGHIAAAGDHFTLGDFEIFVTQAARKIAVNASCSDGPDVSADDIGFVTVRTIAPSPSPSP
jgi:hypothetical protein